jgi:hypothetical protein
MSLLEWQTRLSEALILPQSAEVTRLELLGAVDASKLALYQELMFNTVRDTLQNIYPFTYALLSQQGKDLTSWNRLVDDYRRHCPNRSYKLMGAVSGFHQYLASQVDWMAQYPFLSDLALYEWLEMEVLNLPDAILPDTLKPEVPVPEDFSAFFPVWNPAKRLRAFGYNIPVLLDQLKQKQKNTPLEQVFPNPVDILIYRDTERLGVRFFCLNEMTASLMRLSVDCSYQEALLALKRALPVLEGVPIDALQGQAQSLFQSCLQKGMLLGSLSV